MQTMTGLEYVAENKWENGKIYVPRSGKTYSVSVHLQDINTLIVRGFFGIELFGDSLTLKVRLVYSQSTTYLLSALLSMLYHL